MSGPDTICLWHVTPLFYVPYLLQTGAIFSAARLGRDKHPILPRPSAIRRKTRLGLADFVHLSPVPITPLLRDKRTKGYSHVLIAFDRVAVLAMPSVALLRFNTKRWAHRDDFIPVTDAAEKECTWAEYGAGKYPSLEVLVPGSLPLVPYAVALHVATLAEGERLKGLAAALNIAAPPVWVSPALFPLPEAPADFAGTDEYFTRCLLAGAVLPPPLLPFD